MRLVGYQESLQWMGTPVLTLADLWPNPTRAMIVGLNPAPTSVAVGHYYQGATGQRQLNRLADAGLFERPSVGTFFEESALAAGVGFTDLVKRPTVGENDVPRSEQKLGRDRLTAELQRHEVPLVVCVFRHPADAILGRKSVVGFQEPPIAGARQLFRMPGPFENAEQASAIMATLRQFLARP